MTAISDKYAALGGSNGFLGTSTTAETTCPDGVGKFQHFKGGSIYWHPSTGAWSVRGSIRARWANLAWERGPLGYPISDEEVHNTTGRRSRFQFGQITWMHNPLAEFKVYAQNMALLVAPGIYCGVERGKAVARLVAHLRETRPHVVGLSEMFADGERATVRNQLADIYVDSVSGPDEADLESDGGLMILSRSPILARAGSIFRQCSGVDCLANKGVLHARIQPAGLPKPVDFFLSHTQNPDEGGNECSRGTVKRQLDHIMSFMLAQRHPENPAFLMGDINTDMNNATLKADLMQRLQNPFDIWEESGNKTRWPKGVTEDPLGSFIDGRPLSPPDSPNRHQSGKRLDPLLTYNGAGVWPIYNTTEVVVEQSSPGRDISDHYGVRTRMVSFQTLPVTVTRPIAKVTVALSAFHCLEESDEVGDDTVYFHLTCRSANGQSQTGKSGRRDGVASGEKHSVASPVTLVLSDPGAHLDIEARGMEYDSTSSDDHLGTNTLRITRQELLECHRRTVTRALPRFTGDGGEYVLFVTVKVE